MPESQFVTRRPVCRPAFTLVELLVVIGIIALLISILLPSLNAARRQAMAVKCLSNLRTLGQAMVMYTSENRQTYPQPATNGKITVPNGTTNFVGPDGLTTNLNSIIQGQCIWFNAIDLYLNRNLKDGGSAKQRNYTPLKQDPIWASFDEPTVEQNPTYDNTLRQRTYKMNSYFGNPVTTPAATTPRWARASSIRRSSDTVLIFDGVAFDCVVALPAGGYQVDYGGKWSEVGIRHGRGKTANVLFCDGHASEVAQSIQFYQSSSKASRFNTWQPEFVGESVANDPASTATRNPDQKLYWDFWRND